MPETAGDEEIEKERHTYTREGREEPGFTSAIVPTLEEKMVIEQQKGSPKEKENHLDDSQRSSATLNGTPPQPDTPPQARTKDGKELFGAPADASTSAETDDKPPHARSGVDDANEEERAAPGARATIRKHLASKLGSKGWTLPTSKPHVDPEGFEDPICDAFWKDVWVACAVHNVRVLIIASCTLTLT